MSDAEKIMALLTEIRDRLPEPPKADPAREHIKAEGGNGGAWKAAAVAAHREREKAEADVERLARERDEAQEVAKSHIKDAGDWWRRYETLRKEAEAERDDLKRLADHNYGMAKRAMTERDEWKARADKAEAAMRDEVAEHDKTRAAVERLTRDVLLAEGPPDDLGVSFWRYVAQQRFESLVEWKDRYQALRADMEREHAESPDFLTARVLDADDKRGAS